MVRRFLTLSISCGACGIDGCAIQPPLSFLLCITFAIILSEPIHMFVFFARYSLFSMSFFPFTHLKGEATLLQRASSSSCVVIQQKIQRCTRDLRIALPR